MNEHAVSAEGAPVVYDGLELEAMSFARNYSSWILEVFRPYLGTRLVEVGAGTGSVSQLILSLGGAESYAFIEPSEAMYRQMVEKVGQVKTSARVQTYNDVFAHVAPSLRESDRPDSIIYVNVLEHIEDDEGELAVVHRTLDEGGRVLIFVPALPRLYGSMDAMLGHHRRYTRRELQDKVSRAGFSIIKSIYFDSVGILPWWVKYRVLRSQKMEAGAVKLYDNLVVPLLKRVERLAPPPIGKSILLVAEKA